jgi:hypothetical protein
LLFDQRRDLQRHSGRHIGLGNRWQNAQAFRQKRLNPGLVFVAEEMPNGCAVRARFDEFGLTANICEWWWRWIATGSKKRIKSNAFG